MEIVVQYRGILSGPREPSVCSQMVQPSPSSRHWLLVRRFKRPSSSAWTSVCLYSRSSNTQGPSGCFFFLFGSWESALLENKNNFSVCKPALTRDPWSKHSLSQPSLQPRSEKSRSTLQITATCFSTSESVRLLFVRSPDDTLRYWSSVLWKHPMFSGKFLGVLSWTKKKHRYLTTQTPR